MSIRLADLDIRWTGTDDTTPAGHVLVLAIDNAGLLRLCLYAGDAPADDQFRGSLLIPPEGHKQSFLPTRTTAYNAGGGWVTCFGTQDSMLAQLANPTT
ncbi:hypothetical protein [Streptomyces sp. NPDC007346]|uniref:hypothetical protein n=1 Tax=Streptomyces sp. NPDC007346 TaxID=3154682 RepID=UPI00345669AA